MIRPVALLLALAGCVADTGAQGSGGSDGQAYAYNARQVAESVNAFAQVCLQPNLSGNQALAAAEAAGAGLAAPPLLKVSGKPTVSIVARIAGQPVKDPDAVYGWFRCAVNTRGTWADKIVPDVTAKLQAAGFSVGGFNRSGSTPDEAYQGQEIIKYLGRASRGGKSYFVTVEQSPSGSGQLGQMQVTYISGTTITIGLGEGD